MPSIDQIIEWVRAHDVELWAIGSASLAVLLLSILVVPAIIARLPANYFTYEERPASPWANQYRAIRIALLITKNVFGYLFILAGLAMLLLPGQGLLTILVGFLMVDFPGKYRFEKWLISRRTILRSINWLRRRAGRQPLKSQ